MRYVQILSYVVVVSLTGCATNSTVPTIGGVFGTYVSSPIGEAVLKPSPSTIAKIAKGEASIKVAVAEFTLPEDKSSNDRETASKANLKQYAAEVMNAAAVAAGATLVSKSDVKTIIDHIKQVEKRGTGAGQYAGVAAVDIAILGSISTVSFDVSESIFSKLSTDKKGCTHEAKVTGEIAVYKIPETTRTLSISLNGIASDIVSEGCNANASPTASLIKEATKDAIAKAAPELQGLIAIDTYVLEKRMANGNAIFLISAGKNLGLKPGTKIEFYALRERMDILTHKATREEVLVGNGAVTDKIETNRAWVMVTADNDAGIQLWNVARPKYTHVDCNGLINTLKPECISKMLN